jgi:hypothetical protein
LIINVYTDKATGKIASMAIGNNQVETIPALEVKLQQALADKTVEFDQVVIQVQDSCRYDELMKIIDVCTRQKLSNGKNLAKLSFAGMPD